jgi:hypothetical protein
MPPITEATEHQVEFHHIRERSFSAIGTRRISGGNGKNELSAKETPHIHQMASGRLARSTNQL